MKDNLPLYLVQGEPSRLFPVLSTTSKEGRTTSIVLACMSRVEEFGAALFKTLGQKLGRRATVQTFTEVVFKKSSLSTKERPDGLIVVSNGKSEWRAIVEAKIGGNDLDPQQIERYRGLARDNGIDAVITISNQFASSPSAHPLKSVPKSRSKVPVFHWSWMLILTEADLLLSQREVEDRDQRTLLNELRRFLSHDSAGVRGFDRMPAEWTTLNRLVSSGGKISTKSVEAQAVVFAWHQESKDISLILSRMTESSVVQRISRKHRNAPDTRIKDDLAELASKKCLYAAFDVPDAAAPIEVTADLSRRTLDVGMTLRAPEDRKSAKARVNWLIRQIKKSASNDVFVRALWPGKSEATQFSLLELSQDTALISKGKKQLSPHSFHVFRSKSLGSRFAQQANFISDIESEIPEFYKQVGSSLNAWKRSPPKIKDERASAKDVSPEGLLEDSIQFEE